MLSDSIALELCISDLFGVQVSAVANDVPWPACFKQRWTPLCDKLARSNQVDDSCDG